MTRAEAIAALGLAPETDRLRYVAPLAQLVHLARLRSPLVELELVPLEQLQADLEFEELAEGDVYAALRELERADQRGQCVRLETVRMEAVSKAWGAPSATGNRRLRRRVRELRLSRAQTMALRSTSALDASAQAPLHVPRTVGKRSRVGRVLQRIVVASLQLRGRIRNRTQPV